MAFVFSFWYIVMALLVGGIVASLVVFIRMDKQDKVLIDQFIKEASAQQPEAKVEAAAEETKTN